MNQSFGAPGGGPSGPPAGTDAGGTPARRDGPAPAPPSATAAPDPAGEALRRELAEFRAALAATTPRIAVTPVLLVANVLVFAGMALTGAGIFSPSGENLVRWGANFGPLTLSGQWWRLLTSAFVHIGLLHIAVNMWALWNIGRVAERLLGNAGFAALYLLSALAGSLASLAWNPEPVSAGASGALFGLFGGLLAFLARQRRSLPRPVLVALGKSCAVCAALNVFLSLTVPGIDNAAHLGGLAGGFLAGLALARKLGPEPAGRSLARSAGVLLAGALALAVGGAALPRGVAEAQRALEAYGQDEEAAKAAYNALVPLVNSGQLAKAGWADRLEREVLPIYRRAAGKLPAPEGLPPGTRARMVKATEYARLRVEWMELLIRAGRTGSEADLRAAKERLERAKALYAPAGGEAE